MAKQIIYQFDIGGQTRTLNFGMLAWDIFCETMNVSLGKSMGCFAVLKTDESGNPIEGENGLFMYNESPSIGRASRVICYAGIVSNDRLNGVPDSVSLADIDAIYNETPEIIADIASTAINVRTEKILDQVKADNGSKKKASRSKKSKK